MKIKNVAIKNFRGYSDEINSDFEDLTAFVGKNDIGKSTILEALDIFFNDGKGVTKLDKADLNVESKARQETDISIRICFTDLPEKIVIDATNETSLSAEYLLIRTACLKLSNVILMQVHQKFLFVRCIRRIRNVQTYFLKKIVILKK